MRGFNSLYLLHPLPPWGSYPEKWYNILIGRHHRRSITNYYPSSIPMNLPNSVLPPDLSLPSDAAAPQPPSGKPGAKPAAAPVVTTAPRATNGWKRATIALAAFILTGLFVGVVREVNDRKQFKISDTLDHQGPWYRQAALAPWDGAIPRRQYELKRDFLGRKTVVYHVGPRVFVQTVSGQPAVELYPTAKKK